MAFNGSGVHNRVHDWTQDLASSIPVTASRMDAEHDDMSASLSALICRDGQSTTTARIPFAAGVSAASGSASSVAYAQINDTNTGLYFPGTDQWGLVAGGTGIITSTSAKVTVGVAIDFSGAAAPASSDGAALGSTTQMWSDLFLASGAVINWNNGDVTATHSDNALAFAGASNGYSFDAVVKPAASDGAALGNSSTMWSDLFLASGAVINFNNGDVTITHSADTLAIAGGSLTVNGNAVSGTLPTRQVLTSGASATYTTPAGCRQLRGRMIGPGGGGGAQQNNPGQNGGATSFGTFSAGGGQGGVNGNASSPLGGPGGTGGSGAAFRMDGNGGNPGSTASSGNMGQGGNGGAGPFGGCGRGGVNGNSGGNAIANSGAGGGGGAGGPGNEAGGGGGAGEYVEFTINNPDPTYTYTIGPGGNGGAAGARAGGNGAPGVIVVDEYY